MATNRTNIGSKFKNTEIPSEADFKEIFDSFVHKYEDKASFQMVETGTDTDHYVTPALLRTGLQNIGIITGNCYMPHKENFESSFSGTTLSLEKLPIQYSVKIYKNGQLLQEGEDYTVDYNTAVITFSDVVIDRNIEVDYWYKNFGPNPGNAGDAIDFTSFLHTSGNETKSGILTFNNTTPASTSGIVLTNSGIGTNATALDITVSGTGNGISMSNSSTGTGVKLSNTGAGTGTHWNSSAASTGDLLQVAKDNVVKAKIGNDGVVTAPKYVTTGGTASQFVKGDGSLDSTVYAIDTDVIHTTGNESKDGALTLSHNTFTQDVLTINKNNSANCLKLVQNSNSSATTSTWDTSTANADRKAISIQKQSEENAFITHEGDVTANSFTTLSSMANLTDGLLTLTNSSSPAASAGKAKLYAKTDGTTDMYVMGSDGVEKKIGGVVDLSGKENTIAPGTTAQYYRGDKTWQTLDKATVGLTNVDNTSDLNKPISTAMQVALDLKANLASPSLTGIPTAPTAAAGTNTTQIATTAFVQSKLNSVTTDFIIPRYSASTNGFVNGSLTDGGVGSAIYSTIPFITTGNNGKYAFQGPGDGGGGAGAAWIGKYANANGDLYVKGTNNQYGAVLSNAILTATRIYTFPDKAGTVALLSDLSASAEPTQITITTSVSITTDTLDANSKKQIGKNVIINNGASAINITVNGGTDFCASYLKHGAGTITFVQGTGRTLIQVNATAILNGAVGSTATISSIVTTDYLRISNV